MKKYSIDYTKVQHADNRLAEALVKIKWDNWWDAERLINDARQLLQQYLNECPMVPDEDVYDGWYSAIDVDNELQK